MTKVIFDISMSLDGFVTASRVNPEEPLGDGGQRLHEWAFSEHERTGARPLQSPHGAVPRQDGRDVRRSLVLAPIGWQLFVLDYSAIDQAASSASINTFATRLLARPLS
jgi:hypothetical protein